MSNRSPHAREKEGNQVKWMASTAISCLLLSPVWMAGCGDDAGDDAAATDDDGVGDAASASNATSTSDATPTGNTASVGTTASADDTSATGDGPTTGGETTSAETACDPSGDECSVCMLTNCCTEIVACDEDAICLCLTQCVQSIRDFTPCSEQCGGFSPAFAAVSGCAAMSCGDSCS